MFDIDNRVKPILKWAGGKSGLLPQLVKHFPTKFNRLVEPFVGGGAVFFALNSEISALINDANCELVELYQVVRDTPHELMATLDELAAKYSEAFYYKLRSEIPQNAVGRAARIVFLNKTGFNGLYRQNSQGNFNVPFGKRGKSPLLYDCENIIRASIHLQNTQIESIDFESVIDTVGQGDFLYCDPPYEPLSVTSSFNGYKASGFSQLDQRRLHNAAAQAAERGAFVVISNSTADFILSLYNEWDICKVSARRAINCKGDSRGEITELLIIRKPYSAG